MEKLLRHAHLSMGRMTPGIISLVPPDMHPCVCVWEGNPAQMKALRHNVRILLISFSLMLEWEQKGTSAISIQEVSAPEILYMALRYIPGLRVT